MSGLNEQLVSELVLVLSSRHNACELAQFPRDNAAAAMPGLYSWWCDTAGLDLLSAPFDRRLPALIYAGQAGATSTRSGTERRATLGSRIKGNHIRGNVSSSTFRQTLSAVLREPLGLQVSGERLVAHSNARVSEWMHEHLRVVIAPFEDRGELAHLEHAVLGRLDPPLNLMGMTATPTRTRLKQLRRELKLAGSEQ